MSTLDRDLRRIYDAELKAAAPPAGLADVVAHRAARRRRGAIAGTATAALAIAGAVATLGVSLLRDAEPADESDEPVVVEFVPGSLGASSTLAGHWYCGGAAPAPSPITERFILTWAMEYVTDDLGDWEWSSDSAHPAALNLSARHTGAGLVNFSYLFVQDGLVIGSLDGGGMSETSPAGVPAWNAGETVRINFDSERAEACSARESVDGLRNWESNSLPPGVYEVIPVASVESNRQSDALRALASLGVSQGVTSDGLGPGSWECRQATPTGLSPIDCVDSVVADGPGDIVIFDVPPEFQTPRFRETLIGVPLTYTRMASPPAPGAVVASTTSDFPACEIIDPPEGSWSDVGLVTIYAESADLLTDSGVEVEGYVLADDSYFDGEISLPDGMVLEVYRWSATETSVSVVARAHVVIADGDEFTLDRYAGPTRVNLKVTAVDWCGGAPDLSNIAWVRGIGGSKWRSPDGTGTSEVTVVAAVVPPEELAVLP